MTGFARVKKSFEGGEIAVSLKSVNHRGLDLHFHLPPELDPLENDIRAALKSGLARGHVQVHVSLARTAEAAAGALNRPLMETYMRAYPGGGGDLWNRGAAGPGRSPAPARHVERRRRAGAG